LDLEVARFIPQRLPFDQAEKAETVEPPQVELRWADTRSASRLSEHVGS
jgi:hypothetical protein